MFKRAKGSVHRAKGERDSTCACVRGRVGKRQRGRRWEEVVGGMGV